MNNPFFGDFIAFAIPVIIVAIIIAFIGRAFVIGKWKDIPTIHEYLKKNPDCKTSRGIKCNVCNSSSIKNWGLEGPGDSMRKFICNHCGAELYRTDD